MMYAIFAIFIIATQCAVYNSKDCNSNPHYSNLFPKYADSCGSSNVQITYGDKFTVNCDNYISIMNVVTKPKIAYDVGGKCDYATILLFDPESVMLPPFGHWAAYNIPASNLKNGSDGSDGDSGASYVPPLFPSGGHRYTFFIFCQKDKIPAKPITFPERFNFDVKEFAKSRDLGNPMACNFFNQTIMTNSKD